jgi:hypothetical protein
VTPAPSGEAPVSREALEERDWAQARNSNNVAALRAFRTAHPDSKYSREAYEAEARIQFEATQRSNDPVTLRTFAQNYPDHPFAPKAVALARQLELRAAAPAEIRETLRRYAEAFAAKRIDLVSSLRQLSPQQRTIIVKQFTEAVKIEMTLLANGEPELTDSLDVATGNEASLNAAVQCELIMGVTYRDDFQPAREMIPVHLKRTANGWVITSIK